MNKLKEEVIRNKFREEFRRLSERELENSISQLRNEIDALSSKIHSAERMDSLRLKDELSIKRIEIIEVEKELSRRENKTRLEKLSSSKTIVKV